MNNLILNFKITQNKIEKEDNVDSIISGSYNYVILNFDFDSNWNELNVKKAVFVINNEYEQKVFESDIIEGSCVVPHEVLQKNSFRKNFFVGVYGQKIQEEKLLQRVTTNLISFNLGAGSYYIEIENSNEIDPSSYEIYLAKLQEIFKIGIDDYNLNADKRKEEINEIANEVSKDRSEIESMKKSIETSETNAKVSEQNAQNSANNASKSESNVTNIEKNINALKQEIDETKLEIDNTAKVVKDNSDEATKQANIAIEQANIAKKNATQTSNDKISVETMKNEVSSMKSSIETTKADTEQIKSDTQSIYDDTLVAKNETLSAKESVENSLEKERILSDKKYARAIDSEVITVEEFGQVECDSDGYMKDVEIESNLSEITQEVREGYNLLNTNETFPYELNGVTVEKNRDGSITLNGTNLSNKNFPLSKYLEVSELVGKTMTLSIKTTGKGRFSNIGLKRYYADNTLVLESVENSVEKSITVENFNPTNTTEIGISAWVLANTVFENFTIYLMLVEGTEEKKYEKFGASPSLNYPSEFENMIKNISIRNSGKNLAYLNNVSTTNGYINTTNAKIAKAIAGKECTVSFNCSSEHTGVNQIQVRNLYNGKEYKVLKNMNYSSGNRIYSTFTPEHNGEIYLSGNLGSPYENVLYDIQLEIGNTATEFEHYNGYEDELTLPEGKFIGNFKGYKNYIKDNKVIKNLNIYKVDSNTGFTVNATDDNRVQFLTPVINDLKINLGNNDILSTITNDLAGSTASKKIRFWITLEELGTTSESTYQEHITALKNKLLNNVAEFLYPIENTEELNIENIDLPLFKRINNIFVEDLKLDFKYNISIEEYVEENNLSERKISDSKYARALKTQVEDESQAQVYAENDEVENLKIKGTELTQETREGYNFLKYPYTNTTKTSNGMGFTDNGDGSITINGTATDLATFSCQYSNKVSNDSKYTFITYGLPSDCYMNYYSVGAKYGESVGVYNYLLNPNVTEINLGCEIKVPAGVTVNNVTVFPMLVKGEYTRETIPVWEQYGASPSLEYLSEIKVANKQNIQITKNNLFDLSKVTSTNHVTISDEILTTNALNSFGNFKLNYPMLLIKNNVYLSFDVRLVSGTASSLNIARFNDYLADVIKLDSVGSLQISSNWTRVKFKVELEENFNLKNIWIQIGTATSAVLEVKNIMISYYDVDYEEYYNINNVTVPLENKALEGYADTIDRENKVQNKLVHEVVLIGTENWQMSYGTGMFHLAKFTNIKVPLDNRQGICNYFKFNSINSGMYNLLQDGEFAIQRYLESSNLFFKCLQFSTVEEWKAKLQALYQAGTPVKVYYVVETPVEEPLSEEVQQELDKFKLYDDLNNVFIDKGSLSFTYNKSLSKAFEETKKENEDLTTRVSNLESQILNLLGGS